MDSDDTIEEWKPISEKEILSKWSSDVGIHHFYPESVKLKHKGFAGTPLAEVLSVIVTPRDKGCQLYGRIQVDDWAGSVVIYDLGPEKSHTLSSSGEGLPLSNRDRAILGDRHFNVSLDLKDKNGDVEVIRGSFSWRGSRYNKILVENLEGELGSAQVSYIVHWAALEVNIWAKFDTEHASSDDGNVDFELMARYKKRYNDNDQDWDTIRVFKGNLKGAKNGGVFPLDRAVLTLPCHMNLVIQARVLDDCDDSNSCCEKIEFRIEDITFQYGAQKDLKGKWGSVKVSVKTFGYLYTSLTEIDHVKFMDRADGLFPEWLRVSAWASWLEESKEVDCGSKRQKLSASPSKNAVMDDEAEEDVDMSEQERSDW